MEGLKRFLTHRFTVRVCQVAIGAVFLYAALPKIGDVGSFAKQVHNYRMVPIALENVFAMTLPWIELVAGVAMIIGIGARSGAVVSAGMMIVFIVAIGQAVARGLDIDCGCFGTTDAAQVGVKRILEDFVFLAVAIVGSLRSR
jgi:uncharacterized membrane protein YphA (DoxX/SURF4 family)